MSTRRGKAKPTQKEISLHKVVSKLCYRWSRQQRACREWLTAKERGDGASSCCNIEAHRQVIRTLDQCMRELRVTLGELSTR